MNEKEDIQVPKEQKEPAMNESYVYKVERLFGRNWFILALLSILTTFYAIYTTEKAADEIGKMKEIVYKGNLNTVMTTVDGRAIKVKKTRLEPKFIEKWLANTIVTNFIVSRSELTNGFKVKKFSSPADVIKNSYKLQFIYSDLMSKKNKESQKYLRTYLFKLQGMMAEDKLPEYITINSYSVDKFTYKDNKFYIKVKVKVETNNYDISLDEYYPKKGIMPLVVNGYVDLSESKELNPYGLIVDSFKIGVITKERK